MDCPLPEWKGVSSVVPLYPIHPTAKTHCCIVLLVPCSPPSVRVQQGPCYKPYTSRAEKILDKQLSDVSNEGH